MTNSCGCFSAYHVAFVDSLPDQQLFVHIQHYSWWIDENFKKDYMLRNA